jgi:molecular chaperone GrpE
VTVPNDEQEWEEGAGSGNGVNPAPEQILSLEEQLAAAQAEAARNLDGWQRTQAEFANARKRFDKQRAEAYSNANVELVTKLLPLIDDFERALDSVPENDQADPWIAGMALVYRKMLAVLDEMNVQIIPSVGEPFDPNHHEALTQEPSDEYESGVVVREMRRGYRLGDRVIRPALVSVAP